nr:hypothetical protein DBT45_02380 [Aerococcus tenax]
MHNFPHLTSIFTIDSAFLFESLLTSRYYKIIAYKAYRLEYFYSVIEKLEFHHRVLPHARDTKEKEKEQDLLILFFNWGLFKAC